MDVKKHLPNLLDTIGMTPIVKLTKLTEGLKANIFAKLEFFNPIGSIKDRVAKYMIEKAEREGKIKPGYTIVEASSGNMALGLAMVAIHKGYHCKIIVRDRLSREKMELLNAMGVELVLVDSTLPPESPDSYNNVAPKIARETPNSYYPDQHNNRDNNETHYHTTGPEIWEQMEGKIDYFVAGVGTGGTVCGAGKYLKEKKPAIKVVGVDVKGSIFYDYFHTKKLINSKPYLLEGLGDEFLVGCVDFSIIDDMYQITDKEAFNMNRELVRKEAILAGGSSGAAAWAAIKLAREIDAPANIVTIFPDSVNRYLSSIFNTCWMKEKGFYD